MFSSCFHLYCEWQVTTVSAYATPTRGATDRARKVRQGCHQSLAVRGFENNELPGVRTVFIRRFFVRPLGACSQAARCACLCPFVTKMATSSLLRVSSAMVQSFFDRSLLDIVIIENAPVSAAAVRLSSRCNVDDGIKFGRQFQG